MFAKIHGLTVLGLAICLTVLLDCGTSPTRQYQDGRVILKNSVPLIQGAWGGSGPHACPHTPEGYPVMLEVTVGDEVTYVISGEIKDVTKRTGPLPGGSQTDVEVRWFIGKAGHTENKITVFIDGNVFVEAWVAEGDAQDSYAFDVFLRLIPAVPYWE